MKWAPEVLLRLPHFGADRMQTVEILPLAINDNDNDQ